jgi:glyoxylase I family protein
MAGAVHPVAICTTEVERSLRFWRDGLGLSVLMDEHFDGDWPTLLRAPRTTLRSVFLGDPAAADAGIVELVDLGDVDAGSVHDAPRTGFLLLSFMVDLEATLQRLDGLGLGGEPRRIVASGVAMAVVHDPDGTTVELIDTAATANLDRLTDRSGTA